MKYYIAERQGWRLKVWPSDRPRPDDAERNAWLSFIMEPLDEHDAADPDAGGSIDVLASELYAFMDWLATWCPDPRKAVEG